jgi:DNA-binding transcriptional LysR family regulator
MAVDLNDVVVFTAVVTAGSFTAAARNLDLPPSAVSRRVARLEERLGFKLLHRTTRSLGLTDAGRIYFERTSQIARDLQAAQDALQEAHDAAAGRVRMTAPPDDGGIIWALLVDHLRDHPQVDVEIIHTLEYLDLVEEGIDIALRGGSLPDTTLFTAHRLFDSRMVLVASPAYIAERGTPTSLEDLEDHVYVGMDDWAPNAVRRIASDGEMVRIDVRNRVRVNRLDTARAAAVAGFGIAPMVAFNCWSELQSGALVEVLPGALPGPAPFWVIYPTGRKMSAAARTLVDHIVATAPSVTPPDVPLPPTRFE